MFIPGGRYLYGSGRPFHQVNNCLLLRAEDTREGWADLKYKAMMALMTGAGIGVYYGDIREANARVARTGGKSSGPLALMDAVDRDGVAAVQGGDRRSAVWAGLSWQHPDILEFIVQKDWPQWIKDALQRRNDGDPEYTKFHAPMEGTNISVCLDDEFFDAYASELHSRHVLAHEVYNMTVEKMVTTGEPGFSIDIGENSQEVARNACCEVVTADDSDVCNLGSVVLPKFHSPEQFGAAVRDAVLFLTAGSLYSDVSYQKVADVREKNRRLGLGIIGVHEFCLLHGVKYGTGASFEVLEPYMREYDRALEHANDWQDKLRISRSVAATAIAPNGTIGILAESTPSGDPLYSTARERAVITASPDGDKRTVHVVVDPVAKRLVEQGVDPDSIEDAYSLALQPERRLAMQAYLQSHVDQAVSSTVNLPHVMNDPQEQRAFGDLLIEYLPKLRGITAYPDGARAGQPLKPIPLKYALEHEGETWIESVEETCSGAICGV
jgi:ribonucleoside-diphosphate reductase alpha chain